MFVKTSLSLGKKWHKISRSYFFDSPYTHDMTLYKSNHNYVLFCVCFSVELYTVTQIAYIC